MKRILIAITAIAALSLATSCDKEKHKGLNKDDFSIKEITEEVIISFNQAKAEVDLLEAYTFEIGLIKASGEKDDKGNIIPYSAPSTFRIPAVVTGKGAEVLSGEQSFVVEEGSDKGYMTLTLKDKNFSGKLPVTIGVNIKGNSLIHEGDLVEVVANVKGYLRLEDIAGTWVFDRVMNLEELEMWYEEMEEETADLPTHNAGFSLTFAKDGSDWTVTPSGYGDWNNYFKAGKITYTAPKAEWLTKSNSVILGSYTAEESNMFVSEVEGEWAYQQLTFFSLSNVDRSFSGNEDMGKGAIAMRLVGDELEIGVKDYDAPDWDIMWWDPGFDSDMHSFVSRFKKVK
ncbi:MAG: hypothetical protein MJY67_01190 [Bacteroidales bacterium]|nr:hypothetical protein [Bacteroidales bacterium]